MICITVLYHYIDLLEDLSLLTKYYMLSVPLVQPINSYYMFLISGDDHIIGIYQGGAKKGAN